MIEFKISVDNQECLAGSISIEAKQAQRAVPGTISIAITESGKSATALFSARHARELATTLLAIADKIDQLPES